MRSETWLAVAVCAVVAGCSPAAPAPAPVGVAPPDAAAPASAATPLPVASAPPTVASAPGGASPAQAVDDPLARIAALRGIAGGNPLQGGPSAAATVVAGLGDQNGEVRQVAAAAAVQGANYHQRAVAGGQTAPSAWASDEAMMAALRAAATDTDPSVAATCIAAYARLVPPSAEVEAELLAWLDPARPQVHQAVVVALEEHKATSAAYLDALADARAAADPAVRAQAALSTARVLGREAVALLEAMRAAESDPMVAPTIDAALATARAAE